MTGLDRREVADAEARVRMWRADRPQVPGTIRREVVAEPLGTGDLGQPVRAGDARADRGADRRDRDLGDAARRGRADGLEDRGVSRAPAEHAAQAVEDLVRRRARGPRDEVAGRHQHPRRAGAALGAAAGEERRLERRRAVGSGETLDRLDAPAVDLARGDEAGADLLPVEPHGARATVAGVAAHLGAGQAEVLAQHVDEAPPPVRSHLDASPVDLEPEGGVGDHSGDLGDRAPDQRQRRVPAVVRGPADVVDGRQRGQVLHRRHGREGGPRPPPAELALEAAQPPGDRRAGPDRDPRVDDDPAVDDERPPRRRRSRSRGTRASPA